MRNFVPTPKVFDLYMSTRTRRYFLVERGKLWSRSWLPYIYAPGTTKHLSRAKHGFAGALYSDQLPLIGKNFIIKEKSYEQT